MRASLETFVASDETLSRRKGYLVRRGLYLPHLPVLISACSLHFTWPWYCRSLLCRTKPPGSEGRRVRHNASCGCPPVVGYTPIVFLPPPYITACSLLYCQGCIVIFLSNFLALLLEAELLDAEESGSRAFSAALVIVHVLFFLSIWWNAYVSVKVMFSRSHVQVSPYPG